MKEKILRYLGADHPWAGSIHYYDTIRSTNDTAKVKAEQGAPHGTVCIADRQTGGRGRMGRSFHSPGGTGIYLSVILRPQCKAAQLMHLTCGVAIAVCDAVEQVTGFRPGVKWINDIVANGKKLGGILTELSIDADGTVRYAVIGIGLNCRQSQGDFPGDLQEIAISLETALHKAVSIPELTAHLLQSLDTLSKNLLDQKSIMDRYRKDCVTLSKEICVIRNEERIPGIAVDLEDDGTLLVNTGENGLLRVSSGEVQVRGLWGYC